MFHINLSWCVVCRELLSWTGFCDVLSLYLLLHGVLEFLSQSCDVLEWFLIRDLVMNWSSLCILIAIELLCCDVLSLILKLFGSIHCIVRDRESSYCYNAVRQYSAIKVYICHYTGVKLWQSSLNSLWPSLFSSSPLHINIYSSHKYTFHPTLNLTIAQRLHAFRKYEILFAAFECSST